MAKKTLVIDNPELDLEQKVMALLACIAQEQKAEIDTRLEPLKLSLLQLNLLHALSRAPGKTLTVNELKSVMLDENPNVSRTISKMADAGLVTKIRSAEDQRTVHVEISPKGEQAHRNGDRRLGDLSTGLSKKDLQQLYQLLQKIRP